MADNDKQFRADLVDVIVRTLTQGVMAHINKALKEYDYSGDQLLNMEFDADGNPVNIQDWDFRPMSSNRPRPDAPYLLVGRVIPWSDDNSGLTPPRPTNILKGVKDEDGLIVDSETTGAYDDGKVLVDGLTNFQRQDITINQYVAKIEGGEETDHTFTRGVWNAHKVLLQDGLFYDEYGGTKYKIYHTELDQIHTEQGITMIRFAIHNSRSEAATISAHAIRHYFDTLKGNDDLIDVELEERGEGENPAWAFVDEVGDITDASRLLSEDEVSKGIEHRHEMQVTLKVAEMLHRLDPALESNLQVSISQP